MNKGLKWWLLACVMWVPCATCTTTQQTRHTSATRRNKNTRRSRRRPRRYRWLCTYRHKAWRYGRIMLHSQPQGPGLLKVVPKGLRLKLKVRLPKDGEDKGAFINATYRGVLLEGWSPGAKDIRLRINRPKRFSNILLGGQSGTVEWLGNEDGKLLMRWKISPKIYKSQLPLVRKIRCTHTTIGVSHTTKKAFRQVFQIPPKVKDAWLKPGKIRFAPGSQEPYEGTLRNRFPRKVEWLEEENGRIHVLLYHYSFALVGWIPADRLHLKKPRLSRGLGVLGGLLGRFSKKKTKKKTPPVLPYRCKRWIPLYLEQSMRRVVIGSVLAGTPFALKAMPGSPRWRQFHVSHLRKWTQPSKPSNWLIRLKDFNKHCARSPSTPTP